ncbi:MAG: tetratricopeptide repeat protein [Candidatus Hodarchaeales archaeon]|jgi:tetratricopeptide (TPR) repeat protein
MSSNIKIDLRIEKLIAARSLIEQGELYQALDKLKELVKLSMKEDDKILLFNTREDMAKIYLRLEDTDESIKNYKKCLAISRELKSTFDTAKILHNLASIYSTSKKDLNKAMELFNRSARLYEGIGDFQGAGQSISDAAAMYIQLKKLSKAFKKLELALKLLERAKPGRLKNNSLGLVHSRKAVLFLKRNERLRAIEHLEKSLDYFKKADNKLGVVSSLKNLLELTEESDNKRFSVHLATLKTLYDEEDDILAIEEIEKMYG